MKKFVTVIISFLVLFIFLVINYLLWDKENLLKLRDNDKIQQDWLRGQNLTLQTTVDELEKSVKDMTAQNETQKNKILDLESKVSSALARENENLQTIQVQKNALSQYKSFMKDELQEAAQKWFSDISNNKFEESMKLLDKNFRLWGVSYDNKQYADFVSVFQSIEIQKEQNDGSESFSIFEDDGDPLEIRTRIAAEVSLKKDVAPESLSFKSGPNTFEMLFRYVPESQSWVIKSVLTIQTGKP
jgi:hypothetical protein